MIVIFYELFIKIHTKRQKLIWKFKIFKIFTKLHKSYMTWNFLESMDQRDQGVFFNENRTHISWEKWSLTRISEKVKKNVKILHYTPVASYYYAF